MSKDRNFKIYQELMPNRVKEILIVSNAYDAFIMEEDGGLIEHVYMSYRGISLVNPPKFTMVTTVDDALAKMKKKSFDLIIVMPRNLEMDVNTFGKKAKSILPDVPVVILVHNTKGLTNYVKSLIRESIDKLFVWSGNRNVLWAIVKWVEDRMNVVADTEKAMVRVIIFVEDSPYYYSSVLPFLFESIVHQTQEVLDDGLNEEDRLIKLRARPKILLASDYEEAVQLYHKFSSYVLGIISDIRYPKNGEIDDEAGIHLLKEVRNENPLLPILLLSSEHANKEKAMAVKAHFLDKNSPSLHQEMRRFFIDYLGFGDFIFRLPEGGEEVARAHNLGSMEIILQTVPEASLMYHASMGHVFSNWFLARSEIKLAIQVRSKNYENFTEPGEIRRFLIEKIRETRILQRRGIVGTFKSTDFDPEYDFLKIGDGSMGGKARGLAFMAKLIQRNLDKFDRFNNIQILIPKTLVLTTDCYDQFMFENSLEEFSRIDCPDDVVASRFLEAKLPQNVESDLLVFLKKVRYPLAVRSSSLLEDSQSLPYAGLYRTYMIPNNHADLSERARQLFRAIKLIYASVFYRAPRAFARTTMHRTEEEKMGISIQEIKGKRVGDIFYPTLSGNVQSYNFYPISPAKSEDGSAQLALGLGRTVVEGGAIVRFSLKYPKILPQFSSVENMLSNSQRFFYALKMKNLPNEASELWVNDEVNLMRREVLDASDEDEVLKVSSIYLQEEHKIVDSKIKKGSPVVTFSNILKYNFVPLPELLTNLISMAKEGLGCDVEMEFAMNLNDGNDKKHDFILLQVRPMTTHRVAGDKISEEHLSKAICYSTNSLGRVSNQDIYDIIYVKPEKFSSRVTIEIVKEINELNNKMEKEQRKFLLIGPGRWGSSDPMLGIPVSWNHISSVAGIIETSLDNFKVDPSQGTHFFHNLTSLGVIYLNVYEKEDFIHWDWLLKQNIKEGKEYVNHIRLNGPIKILIDGYRNVGVIVPPLND